jgi:hypothetical protein
MLKVVFETLLYFGVKNGVKRPKNDGRNDCRFRQRVKDHPKRHRLSPYSPVLRRIVNDHRAGTRFSPFYHRLRPFMDRPKSHGIRRGLITSTEGFPEFFGLLSRRLGLPRTIEVISG